MQRVKDQGDHRRQDNGAGERRENSQQLIDENQQYAEEKKAENAWIVELQEFAQFWFNVHPAIIQFMGLAGGGARALLGTLTGTQSVFQKIKAESASL